MCASSELPLKTDDNKYFDQKFDESLDALERHHLVGKTQKGFVYSGKIRATEIVNLNNISNEFVYVLCNGKLLETMDLPKAYREAYKDVVSAMSGVTDSLVKAARAAAEGDEATYRRIAEELLTYHRDTCEALIAHEGERRDTCWFIEDRLRDVERFCRSLAVLRELTVRGQDAFPPSARSYRPTS